MFVLGRSLSSKKMTEVSVLGRCLPSRESKKVTEEKQAPIFEMFVSGGGGGGGAVHLIGCKKND